MYASIVTWTFQPGTPDQRIRDAVQALQPAIRQIAGLRQYHLVHAGEATYVSVILYDSEQRARAGFETLLPAAQQQLGSIVANIQRQNGEVVSGLG